MQIDLNKVIRFQDVATLIASKDDTQNRQLRVTKEGIAFLSDDVGNINIEDLAFRLETWIAGRGYCGEKAAADKNWVYKITGVLRSNWPNPTSTYIDFY